MAPSPERKVGGSGEQAGSLLAQQANQPPPEDEKAEESKGRIMTTVTDLGDRLPIGILDDEGRLHKDLALKPWKTSDERELGRKKKSDSTMPEHVGLVVSEMCSQIGPHSMAKKDEGERRAVVSQMYMADVFYAYCLIRIKAMSSKLKLKIQCPTLRCGQEFPWSGDLNSLEVGIVENIDDILWDFKLTEPFEVRKKLVSHFTLASPKWFTLEAIGDVNDEADIKVRTLMGTIIGMNDEPDPIQLTIAELDNLVKIDFEDMIASINERYLGPNMAVEGECTREVCPKYGGGKPFARMIDWRYDSFFGGSSR